MYSSCCHFSAAVLRVFSTPAFSAKLFLSCSGVCVAFIPPVARTEFPPSIACFSTKTTFLPESAATIAATIPAPPPPIIATSVSSSRSATTSSTTGAFLYFSGLTPAATSAASAACKIPFELNVAPLTPSTLMLFVRTISAGIDSIAFEPIPSVSLSPVAVTFEITPSLRFTVTVIAPAPPNPSPVPVPVTIFSLGVPMIIAAIINAATAKNIFCFIIIPPKKCENDMQRFYRKLSNKCNC